MLQQRPGLVFVMLGAFLVMVYLFVVRGGVIGEITVTSCHADGWRWLVICGSPQGDRKV
jgi:hypothetical protein